MSVDPFQEQLHIVVYGVAKYFREQTRLAIGATITILAALRTEDYESKPGLLWAFYDATHLTSINNTTSIMIRLLGSEDPDAANKALDGIVAFLKTSRSNNWSAGTTIMGRTFNISLNNRFVTELCKKAGLISNYGALLEQGGPFFVETLEKNIALARNPSSRDVSSLGLSAVPTSPPPSPVIAGMMTVPLESGTQTKYTLGNNRYG